MSPSFNSVDNSKIPARPSRSLSGRVAIVTGAGSRANGIGNGRAASILLAEAGARVLCVDDNLDWANLTVSMITSEFGSESAVAFKADVTKPTECKAAVDFALERFGRVDILVNNVGIGGPTGTAVDVDPEEWAQGIEVNVTSMVLMAKYAVPAMERNVLEEGAYQGRGAIVNIASVAGLMGGTPMLLYPTSKGAVINMTRAMAVHHAPSGIRVNCVCPGEYLEFIDIFLSIEAILMYISNRDALHSDDLCAWHISRCTRLPSEWQPSQNRGKWMGLRRCCQVLGQRRGEVDDRSDHACRCGFDGGSGWGFVEPRNVPDACEHR